MTEFKSVNFDEWQKHAINDLKSAEAFEALFKNWGDLQIKPYYDSGDLNDKILTFSNQLTPGDGKGMAARGWYNVVRIVVDDASTANAEALELLMNGAEGIHFDIRKPVSISVLLQDVLPEYIFLSFTVKEMKQADAIRAWLDSRDVDRQDVTGYIHLKESKDNTDHLISLFEPWPKFRSQYFEQPESGEGVIDSLANLMINVSDNLDKFISMGHTADQVAGELVFGIKLGPAYFHEIVRLRAIRMLMYKLVHAWGSRINPDDILIHGISTPWIEENYQPMGNLIKSASSAMAGVLGGVHALTVMPEDAESLLQKRIARNTGIILKEESYLDKTRDALAGAYYIESLTEQLGRAVWEKFQKLSAE
ncbi:methylmalonyl-CoA mutase family protein [Fulvivirga sedimenti]|uniref:Methylmalonyl-CoA mutase family protein n=1 Tax=Fulvivirga sedimenti TaxID=2879465 RepID=A0A9X1HUE0_9BACT|nr:methylmalonyl-CoA mutase family protein [Fulvivirga sedimenti]MCA6075556.1 methylmalonyl-CoA mutase family protein [Fulvivirga sedimenti]MCA6076733.1 methylmalonyl-CoA mutase family protein [Fulvivirga sedimenti]MCA6077861.1 methylmalonyl-CoA mutase family protein [Fulvivirga sedimenti]